MKSKKYTPKELQYLIKFYPDTSTKKMAKKLGRSVEALNQKASRLGIKKSKKYISEHPRCTRTQFKKGQLSKNKGKKWADFMSEEGMDASKKTQFKKGHTPHNHKVVGHERITKDDYVEVKIREPNVFVLKHRLIYEQKKGAIPPGYNIIFLDGNRRNFNIDNLKCVSNEELMNQNTIHRYPLELKKAIRLNNKLLKHIKENETA